MPAAAAPQAPEDEPTSLSFPETAVLDWTIRHADGREEGNLWADTLKLPTERKPLICGNRLTGSSDFPFRAQLPVGLAVVP